MVVHEPIVAIDEAQHRICWAALGTTMTHYNASFQLFSESTCTRGVWIADLLPHEAATRVAALMEQGLAAMARAFGAARESASLR